jgi:hypothetical protein
MQKRYKHSKILVVPKQNEVASIRSQRELRPNAFRFFGRFGPSRPKGSHDTQEAGGSMGAALKEQAMIRQSEHYQGLEVLEPTSVARKMQ